MTPGPEAATRTPASTRGADTSADAAVRALARSFLATYARRGRGGGPWAEPGPVVLAVLLARTGDAEDTLVARAAVRRWAPDALARRVGHSGLHDGGLAGMVVGLRLGATLHPPLASVAERVRVRLAARCARDPWRRTGVGFADYDLVSGPAGILLGLGAGGADVGVPGGSGAGVGALVAHLAGLCAEPGLRRLRIAEFSGQPWPARFLGRVNLGLAHGAPGVLLALTAAARAAGDRADEILEPLAAAAGWVAGAAVPDPNGNAMWGPVAGGPGAAGGAGGAERAAGHREGWCYGTPGVSWALWEAAQVLGDAEVRRRAEDGFRSSARRFPLERRLFDGGVADRLGVCHGAAGVLAIADAFARHAGLPEAITLRTRLTGEIRAELLSFPRLFAPADTTLLGLAGTLAVLLTPTSGDRGWLRCLGLR
ncbi:hypothetical protein B4N89_32385 [Embleya scabrispora]|uniref:Subtilin biosynthesis protein spaC n=1 Tax=Embleya scabrispora TaxID=159449 RepID=A0A1T3NQ43_9ACTN|nr:lanthionine synthetase LanC family protein [Embleya scabrispora]OPC78835.1 hypothetical protein B4N89_32385 [Embleya scabrispora]